MIIMYQLLMSIITADN